MDAFKLSGADQARVENQVNNFNKVLNDGKVKSQNLGKDDFLKLLVTQLANQDPTKPMEDKEFIAQMAQFSSLEQMNNLNAEFNTVANRLASGQAVSLLGKEVTVKSPLGMETGIVQSVTGGEFPQLLINNKYFDYGNVEEVKEPAL